VNPPIYLISACNQFTIPYSSKA